MNELPQHLLTVWNPSYASDAMDDHLRLLIEWADRCRRGEAEAEDVYVWWAKLRSAHRGTPLPHYHDILRIQQQVEADVETHLYLTDYRSLYVGHVDEITADPVMSEHDELDHAPAREVGAEEALMERERGIDGPRQGRMDRASGIRGRRS
jgi:hypothetical protein